MPALPRQFIPALVLVCGLAAGAARAAPTDPAQIQTEAYINLVQADQSLDADRLDEALAQYQAARDYYRQLAADFPGWEPRIIQYRKAYCDNQIADIERRRDFGPAAELPELEPPAPETPTPGPGAAPTPAPAATPAADANSLEIDYLKSRLASLDVEFAAAQNDIESLTAENERLRQELESVQGRLAARESTDQAGQADLRAELAARDRQIQSLQMEVADKPHLRQALNDMEAQVNELRLKHARQEQEIKTLAGEIDDAEIRADQAELRARQAEDNLRIAEAKLKTAEELARSAEQEARKTGARPSPPDRIAQVPAQPAPGAAWRRDEQIRPSAPVESSGTPSGAASAGVQTGSATPAEPPPVAPVRATVPPKPVPAGMTPADFVRQLLQQGDNDGALATVQQARRDFPADLNLVLIEGIALIRLQRYPEAAAMLVELAKNNPRNAEIHANLGAAMMGAGLYDEARETLRRAVRQDPHVGGEYHYNLAQLYALVDPIDLKSARRHYRQARNLGIAADAQLEKVLE